MAADPHVFPLGSIIRITGTGRYDGEYTVEDTGALVRGSHVDLFIPNRREALAFGRHTVYIERIG